MPNIVLLTASNAAIRHSVQHSPPHCCNPHSSSSPTTPITVFFLSLRTLFFQFPPICISENSYLGVSAYLLPLSGPSILLWVSNNSSQVSVSPTIFTESLHLFCTSLISRTLSILNSSCPSFECLLSSSSMLQIRIHHHTPYYETLSNVLQPHKYKQHKLLRTKRTSLGSLTISA